MPGSKTEGVLVFDLNDQRAADHSAAHAQTYPSGPVKLIVPVRHGGAADSRARIVAQRLTEAWGQPVVVDNRPGGNYAVGAQARAIARQRSRWQQVAPDSTLTSRQ